MGQPKKVLILTSVHQVFDTRIYEREALTLVKWGYQLTLVAPDVAAQRTGEGVNIIGIPKPRWRLGRIINWFRLLRISIVQRADLYHLQDPDLLIVGYLLQTFLKKPVIYDRHENYQEEILYKEWIPRPFRSLVSTIFERLERLITSRLAAVIVTVDEHLDYFANATTVHNYPDLEDFLELPDVPRDPHKLIYTGGIGEAYGIYTLISMLALLRDQSLYLDLFGTYRENGAEKKVECLLQQFKLAGKYRFHGQISYREVKQQLASATAGFIALQDIPAFYTLYPRKMFEYMACGLPIVASNLRALGRVISDANCGILVEPENPEAFAKAVKYLVEHPAEARRMGENGRRAVIEKYNWGSEAEALLNLYAKLLS